MRDIKSCGLSQKILVWGLFGSVVVQPITKQTERQNSGVRERCSVMVKGCRTEQRYLIGRPPDVFERLFHVRGEEEVRVWTERMGQKCAVPSFDGGPLLSSSGCCDGCRYLSPVHQLRLCLCDLLYYLA